MNYTIRLMLKAIFLALCLSGSSALADNSVAVPILTYHNFDPSYQGSTTISTAKFEQQLQWLKDNGYTVVPLKDVVNYLQGKSSSLPAKPIVITADDGRETVYQHMLPLVLKYKIPVTLFVYPSAISNASYALTWEQIKDLMKTGYFDIQSHTYWHPNFKQEKERLSSDEYEKFVQTQMVKSKKVLEEKLNIQVDLLAWPFGIFDEYLEEQASKAGYTMAFTIEPRPASKSEKMMAEPRYIIAQEQSMKTFEAIAQGQVQKKSSGE